MTLFSDEKVNHPHPFSIYLISIGKSSLINTLRDLKPNANGAAEVDEVECTQNVAEYPDPINPNLIYYDLPGVGTQQFTKAEYFDKIKEKTKTHASFEDFDFFLILSSTRFTEDNVWLAKEISERGKQFYFVRTKIDIDLDNNRRRDPENYNEENVLKKIRNYCLAELNKLKLDKARLINNDWNKNLFLLSTILSDSKEWDFPRMVTALVKNYPILKQESINMSMRPYSKVIIQEKANLLRNKIWIYALLSGVSGALPIPKAGVAGAGAYEFALNSYRQELNLNSDSLKKLSESFNVPYDAIISQLTRGVFYSKYFVNKTVESDPNNTPSWNDFSGMVNSVVKSVPFLGNPLITGSVAFATTYCTIYRMLGDLEQAAIDVSDYVILASAKAKSRHDEL